MIWRTDKPTEDIILAQLSESFSGSRYALLGICHTPYEYYHEDGEEVPFSAIEKWASLKEDETNIDLEKVFRKYANDNHTETTIETSDGGEPYDNTEEIYEACRYGAERMREQMKLTWKDIQLIDRLCTIIGEENLFSGKSEQEVYEQVLREYNNRKR